MRSGTRNPPLDRFEAICRARGVPLTVQRRAVLEALAAREDHPTADDLWEELHPRLPELSRTTVYRVLDTLVALGVASRAAHPHGVARFDARTERHHHLVCDECGAIRDLEDARIGEVRRPRSGTDGFEIHDYSVQFVGVCSACRSRARAGSPARRGHAGSTTKRRREESR
jgi:Fur family peroxide stress response transcriptional regulator